MPDLLIMWADERLLHRQQGRYHEGGGNTNQYMYDVCQGVSLRITRVSQPIWAVFNTL